MHHELVLIDQSQLRQRKRKLHASCEQSLARLPLELLHGLPQIPTDELRVPIDPVQGARHDVLLCRVEGPGARLCPVGHRHRPRRQPPGSLHHFVGHAAKEEGIGLGDVLGRVTVQVFVRDHYTMVAATVQRYVDGVPKGSHYVLLKRAKTEDQLRGRRRFAFADLVSCIRLFAGTPWPEETFAGREATCSTPCSTQRSRTASVSRPEEATYTKPFIGRPVKSIRLACGSRTSVSYDSGPTRTIRSSFTMPTAM